MVRFLARTVVELVANAIGLLVATWLLQGVTPSASGFLIGVAVFTVAQFILAPLVFKLSFKYVRALTGGIALVTTFVGLLVTTWLTDGLKITGFSTWVIATLVVWVFGVIAVLVLPLVIFKKTLASRGGPGRCCRRRADGSGFGRARPEVDVLLVGVAVDLGELVGGEVEVVDRADAVLDLGRARGADQRRGDAAVAQHPGERHLGQGLAAALGDVVERADVGDGAVVEELLAQRLALGGAAAFGDALRGTWRSACPGPAA